jgi:hypothetical protein
MKITRGNYDGASEFAQFDKSLDCMTPNEIRCVLEHILHLASPGVSGVSHLIYGQLTLAEQLAREQGADI